MIRKSITVCKNAPYAHARVTSPSSFTRSGMLSSAKLAAPVKYVTIGIMMSLTILDTILLNAVAMIKPTAISNTLPREIKVLNSLKNFFICSSCKYYNTKFLRTQGFLKFNLLKKVRANLPAQAEVSFGPLTAKNSPPKCSFFSQEKNKPKGLVFRNGAVYTSLHEHSAFLKTWHSSKFSAISMSSILSGVERFVKPLSIKLYVIIILSLYKMISLIKLLIICFLVSSSLRFPYNTRLK